MLVKKAEEVPAEPVTTAGAEKTRLRLLLAEQDGAPNFRMRLIEVEKGGYSPYHSHNYEHEIFVLAGTGELVGKDQHYPLQAGNVVFVAANEEHQFRNTGNQTLKFICLIPIK